MLAATVAAGIDGLQTGDNVDYNDTANETQVLPTTLEAALDALKADRVMVDALGEELVEWFVRVKREVEIAQLNNNDCLNAFEAERELYFKYL